MRAIAGAFVLMTLAACAAPPVTGGTHDDACRRALASFAHASATLLPLPASCRLDEVERVMHPLPGVSSGDLGDPVSVPRGELVWPARGVVLVANTNAALLRVGIFSARSLAAYNAVRYSGKTFDEPD